MLRFDCRRGLPAFARSEVFGSLWTTDKAEGSGVPALDEPLQLFRGDEIHASSDGKGADPSKCYVIAQTDPGDSQVSGRLLDAVKVVGHTNKYLLGKSYLFQRLPNAARWGRRH